MSNLERPIVSVIMPVRNEGEFMRRSLAAVLEQDYPKDRIEILVVDGMSTDQTRSIIRELQGGYANLKLIDNPKKIVAPGLNEGIRQALGDVIVRVDGHTVIAGNYVSECVSALERSGAQTVGGKMTAEQQGFFGKAAALATSTFFGVGGSKFHYSDEEEYVDTVYLGAWQKKTLENAGYFDEELVRNQDDELNYRIRRKGGKILLTPHIKSTYYGRSTPGKLFSQYFQYGYWKVRVMQKHPRQMKLRHFVPALFVSGVLVSGLLAFMIPALASLCKILLTVYLILNITASVLAAKDKKWEFFPLLPFIYFILHSGYGFGFIAGLFRFAW